MSEEHFLNLQPGTIVNGRYEVVKCLGTGSMGMVYACRHRELAGHLVAMKVLFSEVARDQVAAQRFRNEIVASYGVSHPNVVRAYEYFRDGDLVAFTMEYIGGGDLADRIGMDEPIPIEEIIRMLAQMCSGVQAIHDAGIIHRDLKPENILITPQGDIKITDFGIARTGTGPKLTEHGGVVGTIDYVSPEYLERGQVDARSDIYALGVLAFEMITGEAPFKGKSVIETMTMRLRTDPIRPSTLRPDCPPALDEVILKALRRDVEHRYQTAFEMLQDLQQLSPTALTTFSSMRVPTVGQNADLAALSKSISDTLNAKASSKEVGLAESERGGTARKPLQPVAQRSRARAVSGNVAGGLTATQAIAPDVVSKIKQTGLAPASPRRASQEQMLKPLESVLKNDMSSPVSVPVNGTSSSAVNPPPSVVVGRGSLSASRMKELSMEMYPNSGDSLMRTALYWLLIILVGFGLGILGLRHYRPELFGESARQVVPSLQDVR